MTNTMSESLKKAQKKYIKVTTRTFSIRYNKDTDADVIEMLDRCKNKQEYIRRLIKDDIRANGGDIRQIAEDRKSEKEVFISRDKKTDKWRAVCKNTGLNVSSDSYDILLNKVRDAMTGEYTIHTADIQMDKEN